MIESTTDITSEMKSMEAELEQNISLCLESCCRSGLMKRKNVPKWNFQFSKCPLQELHQVRNKFFI